MSNYTFKAIVHFPSSVTKTFDNGGSGVYYDAMLLLKKSDIKELQDTIAMHQKVNPKLTSHLKEIDREKLPTIPKEYTHKINITQPAKNCSVVNVFGEEMDFNDIRIGDEVLIQGSPKLTQVQSTKKEYIGTFVNMIALIKPKALEIQSAGAVKAKNEFLNALKSLQPAEDQMELEL